MKEGESLPSSKNEKGQIMLPLRDPQDQIVYLEEVLKKGLPDEDAQNRLAREVAEMRSSGSLHYDYSDVRRRRLAEIYKKIYLGLERENIEKAKEGGGKKEEDTRWGSSRRTQGTL